MMFTSFFLSVYTIWTWKEIKILNFIFNKFFCYYCLRKHWSCSINFLTISLWFCNMVSEPFGMLVCKKYGICICKFVAVNSWNWKQKIEHLHTYKIWVMHIFHILICIYLGMIYSNYLRNWVHWIHIHKVHKIDR
jgi:hypothetical protein